ncbi:MAG: phage baseplate assembly protein V [Clostridiales Family XIII bacterium]|jgi:uncharacterized protein involved in type VI secretion and phage assembly|nr:phage baseplate assembly protein V [Clostridiales Family XIII bacterium]
MALYDIIDEIAGKQITKSDTGDPRVYGAMIGLVAENYDKDMPGRICVTLPAREDDANKLQWARVAHPSGGSLWGHYFLPEVGDQVLVVFEGGNIEKPYVVGCLSKDKDEFLSKSVDKDNTIKHIVTRHGSELKFEDKAKGEGDKDSITLTTAKTQHTLKLDNENGLIELTDKDGKNSIRMKTVDGTMNIKAKSRVTIEVGNGIKLVMNGETGAVSLDCKELNIKATRKLSAKTDGMMKVDASQIGTNASSMYKIESGGIVMIGGSPVKIG